MRFIAKIIALLSLLLLTIPSVLFLAGKMELDTVKTIMIVATVIWFVSASYWMWPRASDSQEEQT
jgi:hypothetical protein